MRLIKSFCELCPRVTDHIVLWHPYRIAISFFIVGLLVYANAIGHPFVHDDVVFIEHNTAIRQLPSFAGIFLKTSSDSGNLSIVNAYYRPLLEIFYWIEYRLFGLHAPGYHFFNICLHIINSLLVYILINTLTRKKTLALGVGLMFLIHPVQSEAVASIVGISNLLFFFFCSLSLIFYLFARTKFSGSKAVLSFGVSLVFFVFSLLTKEHAAIFPFMVLLYEWTVGRKASKDRLACMVGPCVYFVFLGGYFVFRKMILGIPVGTIFDFNGEFLLRLFSVPRILVMFFRLVIFPVDLYYYRSVDILETTWASVILLFSILSVVLAFIRSSSGINRSYLIFGAVWFIGGLLPTLNVIPMINEYSFVLAAEHFLYFSIVGFFLFIFVAGQQLLDKISSHKIKEKASLLFIAIILILAGLTIKQNTYWRSEIALFQRTLKFQPKFGRVHILIGRAYYFEGSYNRAIEHYLEALKIMQGYYRRVQGKEHRSFYAGFIKTIYFDLAHCYEAQGEDALAVEQYKKALDIDPLDNMVYNNLGTVLLRMGNIPGAQKAFIKAIEINSQDIMALNNLAVCYIEEKKFTEAKQLLGKVLELDSRFGQARKNLERLYQETTRTIPQ